MALKFLENLCGFTAGRQGTQSLGKEQCVCSSTGALEKVGCGAGVVLHALLRVWLQMVYQRSLPPHHLLFSGTLLTEVEIPVVETGLGLVPVSEIPAELLLRLLLTERLCCPSFHSVTCTHTVRSFISSWITMSCRSSGLCYELFRCKSLFI